jgi:hypothetical protein
MIVGAAIGLALTVPTTRAIGGLLFGIQPMDAASVLAATAVLVVIALLATIFRRGEQRVLIQSRFYVPSERISRLCGAFCAGRRARGSGGGAAIVRRYSWRSASIGLMRDAWNAGT